ncbi:uncharacterized protein BO95DRAFT_478874 [Aspergillus brunneoviolaceus CBS 621.78]|uniref:Uncharacterized protein n=1 Tax=Aspergillus brunneoviolaceus CBS 621.78 TaxID=1450534 RepID=A0ACD1GMB3_9EURO|nr:hypothetical protein BO95DRAFT_478874 [Aspergillus brunneoviolaceus CBS 621.78]RAH50424.1 hypothetical protein BO95DRAFT_478874 [Aspergillus brunneoviolaceus CBS 621.78]
MSPVILCPDVPALFRITRNNIGHSEKAANPVIPTPTQGLRAHHGDSDLQTDRSPAFMCGDLEVFGIRWAIYTRVDRNGSVVDLNQQTAPGPVGCRFDLRAERSNSSLTHHLHIDLSAFPTPVSAVIHDQLLVVHLGKAQIHLNLATSWMAENPYFDGELQATARVLGVEVKLHSFRFQRRGLSLFQETLGNKTLETVMKFLREVFGKLVADDSVFIRAVTQIAGGSMKVKVMKTLLNVRRGAREDATSMVKQLELPENEAALLLGQVLLTVENLMQNFLVASLRD